MRRWRMAVAVCLMAGVLPACGTPDSSFPAEAECGPPIVLPTSQTISGIDSPQAFLASIRSNTGQILGARDAFTEAYPNDTFYRRDNFRPDMAAYADETICAASAILQLESPVAGLDTWTANVHAAAEELLEFTRAGREAVRSRNVSEYREFRAGLNARIEAVARMAYSSP